MVSFHESEEFARELKKLVKKYKSLSSDFQIFCKALKVNPRQHLQISGLGDKIVGEFYKVKKFRCSSIARSSKNSGIRIIYRLIEEESKRKVEFIEITFIEIYHKSQKSNHDVERIKRLYGI